MNHSNGHPGYTPVIGANDENHEVPKKKQGDKAMLKTQTMMRNRMENEHLTGMKVIEGFCMDGMHCWPLQVFAFTMLAVHIICCFAAFYVSANLYSSGLYSSAFYQNGGAVMIVMALLGTGVGLIAARLCEFDVMKTAAFTGPVVSVFVSIVLIGKRGMALGGLGGLCAGIPIGAMLEHNGVGISLGAIVGLLVGGIIGICPFFHWLEMNQRYMNKQHEFGRLSINDSFEQEVEY
uniref:Uncharacterized protein n=1 Tax=Babesia bovis TaxID=5865 RepID=A7AMT0_BABBO|eukprot:XP_001611432.1 hypothetical protein [Babesia bovis T2Bo]